MVTSPQYLGNTLMPVNAFQAKYLPKDELIKTKIMRNVWEKINTFWSKNVHSKIFLKNLTIMILVPPKSKPSLRPCRLTICRPHLAGLHTPVICFFKDHSHVTRYAGPMSDIVHINASVVQGSGLGPSSVDVVASAYTPSTRPTPSSADDTYLIVPVSARSSVSAELEHISSRASLNNVRIKTNKSKHLNILRRSGF